MGKTQQIAPKSKFNRRSTAEEVTAGVDLSGKVALITGVNSGLGLESMRVLASRGAHVIAAARTREKAAEACSGIEGQTTPIACELSDLESVSRCADEISGLNLPIDILMCNAGIMALSELQTRYGIEMQFLTNHLGHFVLVNKLLQRVKEAQAGRIVMLSSMGHQQCPKGGIDFENLSGDKGYDSWKFYGQSKLANVLMAKELAVRLEGSEATAYAVHPGVIRTNLARNTGGIASKLISVIARFFERTVAQGAATQCYVATHPDVAGMSGSYFADCNPAEPSGYACDPKLAARLWQVSEELVADYL